MIFSSVLSSLLSGINRREFLTSSIASVLAVATNSTKKFSASPIPPVMPQPKFWFGQRVVLEWECDDDLGPDYGKTFRDYGHIVGMAYKPRSYDGWVYWVSWYELAQDTHLALPHTSDAPEEELQAV